MTTPVKKSILKIKPTPADNEILMSLTEVVQYVSPNDDDEINVRRVAFLTMLLATASDSVLLWLQSYNVEPPQVSVISPAVRNKPDIPGAISVLASELGMGNVTKSALEVVELIKSKPELKEELFSVYPHEETEGDLNIDTETEGIHPNKVEGLLAQAQAVPVRMTITVNNVSGMHWKIQHDDGILIYIPVSHPEVAHLEKLNESGTPLTLSNIYSGWVETPRSGGLKRSASTASLQGEASMSTGTTPPTTRKTSLRVQMERARDDKVRAIKEQIPERVTLLKRLLSGQSDATILYRALGWAKYAIETRNRFQPKNKRHDVTVSAWESLFAPDSPYHMDSNQLNTIEVHYNRYKTHHQGYDIVDTKDGRS